MTKEEDKLKKFLESDDTAMRRAGLALAKGIEIPTDEYYQFYTGSRASVVVVRSGTPNERVWTIQVGKVR